MAQALLPAAPRLISAHANGLRILEVDALLAISSTAYCRAFEKATARGRNCILGRGRKRVDAEMSLGAAGKSACATTEQA